MAESTDYYRVLGVDEMSSHEEIKQAYRRLARSYHPDRNPNDMEAIERFKEVQEAYNTVGEEERRRAYDRARRNPFASFEPNHFDPSTPFGDVFAQDPYGPAEEPGFFVPPGEAPGVSRGRDAEALVRLTFDQALRGGQTEVRLGENEIVRLTIPQGVRSGLKIRVRDHGQMGPGGRRGDLYVTFRVDPSTRFRREGNNLHIIETISAFEAIFGTARSITNAYGQTIRVQIAPGTQPGERLRLRGQGMVTAQVTGDLFVEVQVTIPRSLSPEQRAELEACAQRIGVL